MSAAPRARRFFARLLSISGLLFWAGVVALWYGVEHGQPWVAATGGAAIAAEFVGVGILVLRKRSSLADGLAEKRRTQHPSAGWPPRPGQPAPTAPTGEGSDTP